MRGEDHVTTTADSNKETVRNLLGAINDHRIEGLTEYMAPDVVDHNKIIHGEADEPGAAFDGFARQLAASATPGWTRRN
jgi:hypothetical protein